MNQSDLDNLRERANRGEPDACLEYGLMLFSGRYLGPGLFVDKMAQGAETLINLAVESGFQPAIEFRAKQADDLRRAPEQKALQEQFARAKKTFRRNNIKETLNKWLVFLANQHGCMGQSREMRLLQRSLKFDKPSDFTIFTCVEFPSYAVITKHFVEVYVSFGKHLYGKYWWLFLDDKLQASGRCGSGWVPRDSKPFGESEPGLEKQLQEVLPNSVFEY